MRWLEACFLLAQCRVWKTETARCRAHPALRQVVTFDCLKLMQRLQTVVRAQLWAAGELTLWRLSTSGVITDGSVVAQSDAGVP